MQGNIWNIMYLNYRERCEDMFDHRSYTHLKQLWNLRPNWKPNEVRSVANLSRNFAICWLVSFDPNFCALFNGLGLVVAKWVLKQNFPSEMYNIIMIICRQQ